MLTLKFRTIAEEVILLRASGTLLLGPDTAKFRFRVQAFALECGPDLFIRSGAIPFRSFFEGRNFEGVLQREGAEQTEPIAMGSVVNAASGHAPSVGRFHGHLRA
jgi:hypothetical protein